MESEWTIRKFPTSLSLHCGAARVTVKKIFHSCGNHRIMDVMLRQRSLTGRDSPHRHPLIIASEIRFRSNWIKSGLTFMKWKRLGDYATSCKGSIAIDDADKKGRIELKLLDLHERIKKKTTSFACKHISWQFSSMALLLEWGIAKLSANNNEQ